MAAFTISSVARDAGVNVETIRFYQRQGLLLQPKKPLGGIRRYSDDDVMRVRFIKSAQRLGFKLEEVALLLKLDDGTHCREAKGIAERKLSEIQDRITDLRRMETLLSGLVKRCAASRGQVTCPLISSLRGTV